MRERVLVEDGEIAHDIAASMMVGNYHRGERVIHGAVALEPATDHQPVFLADDRQTGDVLGAINAGGVATARELVEIVERVADRGEVDR